MGYGDFGCCSKSSKRKSLTSENERKFDLCDAATKTNYGNESYSIRRWQGSGIHLGMIITRLRCQPPSQKLATKGKFFVAVHSTWSSRTRQIIWNEWQTIQNKNAHLEMTDRLVRTRGMVAMVVVVTSRYELYKFMLWGDIILQRGSYILRESERRERIETTHDAGHTKGNNEHPYKKFKGKNFIWLIKNLSFQLIVIFSRKAVV